METPQNSPVVQAQTFPKNKYFRLEPGMMSSMVGSGGIVSNAGHW